MTKKNDKGIIPGIYAILSKSSALPVAILIISLALLSVTLLSYSGSSCRLFDTFCHFRLQALILSVILGIVTLLNKKLRKTNSAVISIIMVLNFIDVFPWYISPAQSTGKEIRQLRICMINVLRRNKHSEDVRSFVRTNSPDILVFMEVDKRWLDRLKELDKVYPEKIVSSQLGSDGILIYSKFPIINHQEIKLSPKGRPNFLTKLDIDGTTVNVFVAHPVSPTRKKGKWEDRNTHIENLAKEVNKVSGPVIVIADLNTTMWSPFYKKLISDTGLINTRKGFGINGSYPAPYAMISGLPIDHILTSKHFRSRNFKCGPYIGSDHLPIWTDMWLCLR